MENKPNINGKRLNKLEEVVKLLQKLNEDYFIKEELDEKGYPIHLMLECDGSGTLEDKSRHYGIYNFSSTEDLYQFLTANKITQLVLAKENN